MKIKTSITLSEELLREIDSIISSSGNRSLFIENAIRSYIEARRRKLRDQGDYDLINKSSDELNAEAEDILSYQVPI